MIKKKLYLRMKKNSKRYIRDDLKYQHKGITTDKFSLRVFAASNYIKSITKLRCLERLYKEQK